MAVRRLIDWFAGGERGYMTLVHCMAHDTVWITITVVLDLAVAVGYALIALHWWGNERGLPSSPARAALRSMKNIFVFCGICGYIFIPIKMFWPAWRLYDLFLGVLVFYTWRYALGTRQLHVVYNELGCSEKLAIDLELSREEARRKSHFLNAVSHDLKTPLNGLVLQAEVAELNAATGDVDALRDALVQIKASARGSAELLNHFLELGRLEWSQESLVVSDVRLADLYAEIAGAFEPVAGRKGLTLGADAPGDLVVRTDRGKLRRVLENLLDNAVKFTPRGEVTLATELKGSSLCLHVADTGIGIEPQEQVHVFDDFVQVYNRERDSRKGYGLGLAIARRLADQLGGHLTVESRLGRGSRFSLVLPSTVCRVAVDPPGGRPVARGPVGEGWAARPGG